MATSGNKLTVRNWAKFQHYHDRCPPWIKLATDTFQNPEFARLQVASKLLAICIWTLASHSKDGTVPDDLAYIRQWGFLSSQISEKHLNELINQGFVIRASKVLADCKQDASKLLERGEERRGETERETEKSNGRAKDALVAPNMDSFNELWKAWPRHTGGKAETHKKFLLVEKGEAQLIVARGLQQVEFWKQEGKETQFIPWLKTWLNQRRFDTEPELEKAGKGNGKSSTVNFDFLSDDVSEHGG